MGSYVPLTATACNCPMPKVIDLHIEAIDGAWSPWMLVYKAEMAIFGDVLGHHFASEGPGAAALGPNWHQLAPLYS